MIIRSGQTQNEHSNNVMRPPEASHINKRPTEATQPRHSLRSLRDVRFAATFKIKNWHATNGATHHLAAGRPIVGTHLFFLICCIL